ncbi:MAG: hypothetical protein ACYSUC_12035 [Planctomycetota bacterium]
MNRPDFLKALGTCTAALAVPGCRSTANKCGVKASAERPNVLFYIWDDQSWLHTLINRDKANGRKETIMPATSRTF